MRKCVIILLICITLIFCACTNRDVSSCDHCNEKKETSSRLVGNVDMVICDDCYENYLQGEWGSEYK